MLIVGLTESSARFITGLIAVLIVMAFFGWLSQATGINPFILIGVFLLGFAALIVRLVTGSGSRKVASDDRRCGFIRANESLCVLEKVVSSDYCQYHTLKLKAVETIPVSVIETTPVKSVREKRSQCGFIMEDGSKCKKLKSTAIRYCNYHLKLEETAASKAT